MLDQLVAIDGKTMRRSFARERGQKALHMVTAWMAERGVQLGQLATEEKSKRSPRSLHCSTRSMSAAPR